MRISAIVNTLNEEDNIADCLESLAWVDEIVVVDMDSDDKTKQIAYKYTPNVYNHKRAGYVEPARNFAIAKATGDWMLILDADERISPSLAGRLRDIAQENAINFVRIPRKNIIFGTWMKHTRWWPDYNVRFFKRDKVEWLPEIHSIPITQGEGINLPEEDKFAILHHNYVSLAAYFDRMERYTTIQAKELIKDDYQLHWPDMLLKPLREFLSRFFAAQGYEDGLHGLVLAMLQAFSEFLVYLKVWEHQGFKAHQGLGFKKQLLELLTNIRHEVSYWLITFKLDFTTGKAVRLWLKILRRITR